MARWESHGPVDEIAQRSRTAGELQLIDGRRSARAPRDADHRLQPDQLARNRIFDALVGQPVDLERDLAFAGMEVLHEEVARELVGDFAADGRQRLFFACPRSRGKRQLVVVVDLFTAQLVDALYRPRGQ